NRKVNPLDQREVEAMMDNLFCHSGTFGYKAGVDTLCFQLRERWEAATRRIDEKRIRQQKFKRVIGRVPDDKLLEDESFVLLAASASNLSLRWNLGKLVGSGSFGNVYMATNVDTSDIMAVKEILLPDPRVAIPLIQSIKKEMSVMELLTHQNIV